MPRLLVRVARRERPDLAVLSHYGAPIGLELSLRHRRPRWPYCSRPWCPNNSAYIEDPGVYVAATKPSPMGGRVRVYPRGPLSSRLLLSLAPRVLSPGGIHGRARARIHRLVTWAAQRLTGREALPSAGTAGALLPVRVEELGSEDSVIVVGGGLAGVAASLEASRYGLRVLLVEHGDRIGGFLGLLGGEHSERLRSLESSLSRAGVRVLTGSSYIGYYDEGHAVVRGSTVIVARRAPLVYAGGSESPPPVTIGNDLPGVVSAQYILDLVSRGYKPRRVAVVGDGWWGTEVAERLARLGTRVYLVARRPSPTNSVEAVEAGEVAIKGSGRVEWLEVDGASISVDWVVSAVDEYPDASPVYSAGYRPRFYPGPGCVGPEPLVAEFEWLLERKALVPAGSAMCERDLEAVEASGVLAGTIAAWLAGRAREEDVAAAMEEYERRSGRGSPSSVAHAEEPGAWLSGGISGLQYVDLEEDVTLADLLEAWDKGYRGMEKIKRVTGLGTGLEQGRFSAVTATLILSHIYKVPVERIGLFRARPPHSVPEVSVIGGEPYSAA